MCVTVVSTVHFSSGFSVSVRRPLYGPVRGGVIKSCKIWKIIKNYCHQMSHFKAKMYQIRFVASVFLSLCAFVVSSTEFDTMCVCV